jgi:hypothetical protein
MAKTGRPTSYSTEIADAICEEIATTDHCLLSICVRLPGMRRRGERRAAGTMNRLASVLTSVALQRVPRVFHHLSSAIREIFQYVAIGFL